MTEAIARLSGSRAPSRFLGGWCERSDLEPILTRVQPFTMVTEEALVDLARQVHYVLEEGIPGGFVECGVWRGGAAFLIAELLREAGVTDRKVWLFDSFEGLPEPQAIDGPAALAYAQQPNQPWYFDNCRASLEDVQQNARALGVANYVECVKGWFDETLPAHRNRIGPIALLRVDCDWYASVRCALENMYDLVVHGGFVVIDDYYSYDGCAQAVHEFLAERGLPHRLEPVLGPATAPPACHAALFRKGPTTWNEASGWGRRVYAAVRKLETVLSPGATCLLVDEEQWGLGTEISGRRLIPFTQQDGVYAGPPADDLAAIQEMERARCHGATHIVFAWPAFWWLEHYAGFAHHLRARYRCTLQDQRLVVFDLRSLGDWTWEGRSYR